MTRLDYLSPDVLERLLVWRVPPTDSIKTLIEISYLAWAQQMERVFDEPNMKASGEASVHR